MGSAVVVSFSLIVGPHEIRIEPPSDLEVWMNLRRVRADELSNERTQ